MRGLIGFVLCLSNLLDIRSFGAEAVGIYPLDTHHRDNPYQDILSRKNNVVKCGCSLLDSSDSDSGCSHLDSSDSKSSTGLDHNNEIVIEGNQHFHNHNHNYFHIDVGPDGDTDDLEEYDELYSCEGHHSPERGHHSPEQVHTKPEQVHTRPEQVHTRPEQWHNKPVHGLGKPVQHRESVKNPTVNIANEDYMDDEGIAHGTYDVNDPEPGIRDKPRNIHIPKVCTPMKVCESELMAIVNKLNICEKGAAATNAKPPLGNRKTQGKQQLGNRGLDDYYYLEDDHIDTPKKQGRNRLNDRGLEDDQYLEADPMDYTPRNDPIDETPRQQGKQRLNNQGLEDDQYLDDDQLKADHKTLPDEYDDYTY